MSNKIYIASSWKHKEVVEGLTNALRDEGYKVLSWIDNNELLGTTGKEVESWIETPEADKCFKFDIESVTNADLVIYVSPSGVDSAAEVGAAYVCGVPIIGYHPDRKNTALTFGLMRKMIDEWYDAQDTMLSDMEYIFDAFALQ